ncbi:MAG: TetR/AcrR family transcriptional regulator [Propioniciclava sp.]
MDPAPVPDVLVEAALAAASSSDRQVRDIPVAEIARRAGMSRATMLRRLGGTRGPLDEAVRARGVDPGGRSVRERGIEAAAMVISELGLAATTMEAIATRAGCSVDSLYAAFGARDELLSAAFAHYTPIGLVTEALFEHPDDLLGSVEQLYQRLAGLLLAEPRLAPAMVAEVLARSNGPTIAAMAESIAPQMYAGVGQWLQDLMDAGRIREMPLLALFHQLVAPLTFNLLIRPAISRGTAFQQPEVEATIRLFAEAFVRAVARDPAAELHR